MSQLGPDLRKLAHERPEINVQADGGRRAHFRGQQKAKSGNIGQPQGVIDQCERQERR